MRLGFTENDIDSASDHFIDSLVAWGSIDHIEKRIREHEKVGATHVCIQAIPHEGKLQNTRMGNIRSSSALIYIVLSQKLLKLSQ